MKMKNSNIDRKNPKLKKELTFKKNVDYTFCWKT